MTVRDTKFVGSYEIGHTLGEGSFGTVKFARNRETGEAFAIKIIDKHLILKHKMVTQMKREITTMKLIKHPNVVHLKEVLATKKNIYIVLEYVNGGELFEKIVESGKLPEDQARKYFRQLIHAVDYCHSRGVYHRDLKPENLLLDGNGDLKVSDFGLSALSQQCREDGLFHTTCGTPNYVAPEVLNEKGYDGSSADVWSCGIILYVLLAGYLPFDDMSLPSLYRKIGKADVIFPSWFSAGAKDIIKRILDPDPRKRMKITEVMTNAWFKVGDVPSTSSFSEAPDFGDVNSAFSCGEETFVAEPSRPSLLNAFELISMSRGLDLSGLFKEQKSLIKSETRFTSRHPASEILNKMASLAATFGFRVEKKPNCKMKMKCEKPGRKGCLTIASEVFEVGPSLFMVDLRKINGDTLEYKKFQEELSIGLKDIVWKTEEDMAKGSTSKSD